jgi:hypothetical protein
MSKLSLSVEDSDMIALVVAGPFTTKQQVADLLDASDEVPEDGGMSERMTEINNARLQGLAPTTSSWDTFLEIMSGIATVAGVVTGVTTAITGVYAIASL